MNPASLYRYLICVFVLSVGLAPSASAVQVLLDEPVRAGELTLFPSYDDDKVFYYVLDKARLAEDENGRKQFSLLRYVDNKASAANDPESTEGEGGGILHALVTLEVTQEQIRDAQRELQRVRPGARIQGPVIYKSGKFALISAFADENGDLTEKVLGVGSAPILDGQKAAVSLLLTKQGSKILWQSFHTPTPDISFSFEMDMEGYRSPKRGVIEANFEQIYNHQAFNVGLASTYLSGEIKGAFDDLYREGAIKVTQVGDDDDIDKLLELAYKKLTDAMFQSVGSSGNSANPANLAALGGQQQSMLDRATTMLSNSRQEARQENARIRRENAAAEERSQRLNNNGNQGNNQPADARNDQAADGDEDEERPDQRYSQAQPPDPDRRGANDNGITPPARQQEEAVPAFAIVASYEMKRVRQRGVWKIDLNKYTADVLTLRFDENIGDMRQYLDDGSHFRAVNLDDPLFRQREVSVFLDGMNGGDFGDFVNFVTVQMRKRHAGGDLTQDEVRIDRDNFNSEGNAFKLLYGWKGDNDRSRWLDYEYRALWSFHGGHSRESDWSRGVFGAINVAPEMIRRSLQVEADPDILSDAGVRAVTVKIYYQVGAEERSEQISLRPAGSLSTVVNYLTPRDAYDYEYEITWHRRGQPSLQSGRQQSSDALLFADELPEGV